MYYLFYKMLLSIWILRNASSSREDRWIGGYDTAIQIDMVWPYYRPFERVEATE